MLVITDRVRCSTSTTGTGAWTLGSPPTGYQTFPTSTTPQIYGAWDGAGNWEVGWGICNGTTLTRNPMYSSNSNALVNFSTGPNLWGDAPASLLGSISGKNRIINGDMRIDQYLNGGSGTAGGYMIDRWTYGNTQTNKLTYQQNAGSVTPPVGFSNYLGITSSSAYSVLSSDTFFIMQKILGLNLMDLAWGTANAKPVTLSFWVYSSLTGTFGGAIVNGAANYSYPFTYSIPVANTWTPIVVTIPGPTSGTWVTTNATGASVRFGLGVGSTYSGAAGSWSANFYDSATGAVSVVGTNGATFYITGVQLEAGLLPTAFDFVDYATMLQRCFYYYQSINVQNTFSVGVSETVATAFAPFRFPTKMRAAPSITLPPAGTSSGDIYFLTSTGGNPTVGSHTADNITVDGCRIYGSGYSGLTAGGPSELFSYGVNTITLSAEL